jgi:hypothetical protein
VDKRPHKHFVKAYMHNGYFKSALVAFLRTMTDKETVDDPRPFR